MAPRPLIGYVLQRTDGQFVARPGSARSYTRRQGARVFATRSAALADSCGNETARALADFLDGEALP